MADAGPLLLLDQGSHSTKAFLVADGTWAASAETDLPGYRSGADRCEHDAGELLETVRSAIRRVWKAAGGNTAAVAALATQRSTIACWDRETGEPLAPILSWQDRRNAQWLDRLGLDAGEIRRITGLLPSPHYGASKLRWCLDHLPRVREARDRGTLCMGPLSSFVLFGLLEERPFVVDPANASRTLLWDLRTGDWSPELLRTFGVPVEALPACVPSRHRFGTLAVDGSRIPLSVCTGDQAAALFAGGAPRSDTVYVNMGTGAFVQRVADGPAPEAPGLLQSVAWQEAAGHLQVLEGTVNGAGAAVAWLARELGEEEGALLRRAEVCLAGRDSPPLFLNAVGGLGAPYWIADCPSRFLGEADTAGKLVAVIESIAFLVQVNISAMEAVLGQASRIVVSGGLASLDGLCERIAELSGAPVERPRRIEATAAGLAYLLAGREGGDSTPPDVFSPAGPAGLRTRFAAWRAAMGEMVDRNQSSWPGRDA